MISLLITLWYILMGSACVISLYPDEPLSTETLAMACLWPVLFPFVVLTNQ